MTWLRKHWFDLGGLLALAVLAWLFLANPQLPTLQTILWLSLASLFIHQLEEYRYPGYFPGMVNSAMYKSTTPDRYPLNPQTSFVVNVPVGWLAYFLAALFGGRYVWLGIATLLVSLGNLIAHTVFFNLKGKTFYNPGMVTALTLFLPLIYWFGGTVLAGQLAGTVDWIAGVVLGIALNVIGIVKLISWMADRGTPYAFERRQLRPEDR